MPVMSRIVIIGAGSRGKLYARCIQMVGQGVIAAVVEPIATKREAFGKRFIWGPDRGPRDGEEFADWPEFVQWQKDQQQKPSSESSSVDIAFVCVLDHLHRAVVEALAPLGLHIMCEKPLACSLDDCLAMFRALQNAPPRLFSVGHVLRYTPHNMLLRKLLLGDRVVGDILSIEHTEPVGWWHFTHSYVRGNWRRENTSAPSLLTKCCHDMDLLLWLLSFPVDPTDPKAVPHPPARVSSSGSLQFFKKSRKPAAAGDATNCLQCPVSDECQYAAPRIYVGPTHRGLEAGNTGWPISVVVPDIENIPGGVAAQRARLLKALAEDYDAATMPAETIAARNWFGRCVFESDNDVCDEQVVMLAWDETAAGPAKTATLHMVAHTRRICERYMHVYGSDGEIIADSTTITVHDFHTGETRKHRPEFADFGHGGGDLGLVEQFLRAVDKVQHHGWNVAQAQAQFIGCTLAEIVDSHALVFAAEEARRQHTVVDWGAWREKVAL